MSRGLSSRSVFGSQGRLPIATLGLHPAAPFRVPSASSRVNPFVPVTVASAVRTFCSSPLNAASSWLQPFASSSTDYCRDQRSSWLHNAHQMGSAGLQRTTLFPPINIKRHYSHDNRKDPARSERPTPDSTRDGSHGGASKDPAKHAAASDHGKSDPSGADGESIATSVSKYLHIPHLPKMPHRPTKEELLAAATGFWSRLRVRFKWMSIRSMRPWNADEWGAFVSWFMLGHIVWILVGTTTFFSLLIISVNTVVAQGMSRHQLHYVQFHTDALFRNSCPVGWRLFDTVSRSYSDIRIGHCS
jgi:hypothetical protein